MDSFEKLRINDGITRAEMAKMISVYAENVLDRKIDTNKFACSTFQDMDEVNEELKGYIIKSCQLGLM